MKSFLFILALLPFTARAETGLGDGDTLRFGMSIVRTVVLAHSSGGARIELIGSKKARLDSTEKLYRSSELTGLGDYILEIKTLAPEIIVKHDIKSSENAEIAGHVESFSGTVSGKEINEAYSKGQAACPDCKSFMLAVRQDIGWGMFDLLPLKDHTGAHSLNRKPSVMLRRDQDGAFTGFETMSGFMEYDSEREVLRR